MYPVVKCSAPNTPIVSYAIKVVTYRVTKLTLSLILPLRAVGSCRIRKESIEKSAQLNPTDYTCTAAGDGNAISATATCFGSTSVRRTTLETSNGACTAEVDGCIDGLHKVRLSNEAEGEEKKTDAQVQVEESEQKSNGIEVQVEDTQFAVSDVELEVEADSLGHLIGADASVVLLTQVCTGVLRQGEKLLLGPGAHGEFVPTVVVSLRVSNVPVCSASAGQCATIVLRAADDDVPDFYDVDSDPDLVLAEADSSVDTLLTSSGKKRTTEKEEHEENAGNNDPPKQTSSHITSSPVRDAHNLTCFPKTGTATGTATGIVEAESSQQRQRTPLSASSSFSLSPSESSRSGKSGTAGSHAACSSSSRTRAALSGAGLVLLSPTAMPTAHWEFEVRMFICLGDHLFVCVFVCVCAYESIFVC
jgi:hypothetical protein